MEPYEEGRMPITKNPIPVEVTLRGNVGEFAGKYARGKIATALDIAHGPVLTAHVVLDWRHNPAAENHAIAEASANVDGLTVRAKTAAPTMPEAVDDLEYRLRRQLAQLQDRNRTRHRRTGIPASTGGTTVTSHATGSPPSRGRRGPGRWSGTSRSQARR